MDAQPRTFDAEPFNLGSTQDVPYDDAKASVDLGNHYVRYYYLFCLRTTPGNNSQLLLAEKSKYLERILL